MKITLIIGRAGSGKSYGLFKEAWDNIRSGEPLPIKFLVPEQATHHTERRLIAPPDISGCLYTEVLSFRRLFTRLDKGNGPRIIDEVEKRFILAATLRGRDFDANPFNAIKGRPGFIASLSSQIKTIKRTGTLAADISITDDDDVRVGFISAKLEFTRRAFDAYQATLDRINARDMEDCLDEVAARAGGETSLDGTLWFIDGFSGFTPQEKSVLTGLMKKAAGVKVALCLDPVALDAGLQEVRELYTGNYRTYEWLRDLAKTSGYEFETITISPSESPRFKTVVLSELEANLFTWNKGNVPSDGIGFIASFDDRDAARRIASGIKHLVADGVRYRDIAVVGRGLDASSGYMAEAFDQAGIPHFIDRRSPLGTHPVSRLVMGLWDLALKNFHRDPYLDILRTGLSPLSQDEIDKLENFLLAYGLSFNLIPDEWLQNPRKDKPKRGREENREKLRNQVELTLRPIVDFLADARCIERENLTVADYVRSTIAFLDAWLVKKKVIAGAEIAGSDSDEQERIYDAVLEILGKLSEVFGDDAMSHADFAALLRPSFDILSTGRIPPAMDAVVVGEISRSRVEETRAVFIFGLDEGRFPKPPAGIGLFDEREARELSEQFIEWGCDPSLVYAEEEYLFYIACTRAREKLFFVYNNASDSGGAPSPFVKEASRALGLALNEICEPGPVLLSPSEAAGGIAASVSDNKADDGTTADYIALKNKLPGSGELKYVFSSLGYSNSPALDTASVGKRAKAVDKLDATRLRSLSECPFRYFARYDLGLEPRTVSEVTRLEVGSFIHKVFEQRFRLWRDSGVVFSEDIAVSLADDVIKAARDDALLFRDGLFRNNPRELIFLESKVLPLLRKFIVAEVRRLASSAFKPSKFEWAFGITGQPGVMLDVPDGEPIELTGRLDRVDVGSGPWKPFAIAFDYKFSYAKSGLPEKMRLGLEVQVPIYIKALDLLLNLKPVGGLLFFLEKGKASDPKQAEDAGFKRRGIFVPGRVPPDELKILATKTDGYDECAFEEIISESFTRMGVYARRLLDGDIKVWPCIYNKALPCGFCDYSDICRVDPVFNNYRHPEVEC